MRRRVFLITIVAAGCSRRTPPEATSDLRWFSVGSRDVDGRVFTDTEGVFDRLPLRARAKVSSAIWGLSRMSAGLMTMFRTDAAEIHVSLRLSSAVLQMPYMTAAAVSGLDLYAKDAAGVDRWVSAFAPQSQVSSGLLVSDVGGVVRDFRLYLPLHNGVEELKIGVPAKASFQLNPPGNESPIVCYGTSITQGLNASRAGMTYPAILGRRLNRRVINLGLSGHGVMDAGMSELLSEIPAAVYVIDCLPNMTAELIRERTIPFVNRLRTAQPECVIVLLEDRSYGAAWIKTSESQSNQSNRESLREQFELLRRGDPGRLHLVGGAQLLGSDGEATSDGSHPTDLGFQRIADVLEPVVRAALEHGVPGLPG